MSVTIPPCYIGDGVYVSWDGYHIWLRTGTHDPATCHHAIALEPEVLAALDRYRDEIRRRLEDEVKEEPTR